MELIDTHAHLDFDKLYKDLDEVVARAKKKGVSRIINVGIDLESSKTSVDLAKNYDGIYASVGVHPHDADRAPKNLYQDLSSLIEEHREQIVAVGEAGLDYVKNYSPEQLQKQVFDAQLEVARDMDLPIIIHGRGAHDEAMEKVKSYSEKLNGVFHCFGGDVDIAKEALELGFYISFTGNITFKKASQLREVVKEVPLDKLMVETDCPFMAPVPFRGKTNEPAYVRLVAEQVAEIKNVSFDDVVKYTGENALELFEF